MRIVPEQQAFIVERLGKYDRTLGAGLHLLIPFVERIAYRQSLKEEAMHVQPQTCVTADNVQLNVDGILYLRVVDPEKASYGIDDYRYASTQLAQTTMRSEMGRIDLDRSFSERDEINDAIVRAVDEASDPWGIKVTRYEVRDISPPDSVLQTVLGRSASTGEPPTAAADGEIWYCLTRIMACASRNGRMTSSRRSRRPSTRSWRSRDGHRRNQPSRSKRLLGPSCPAADR